MFQYYTMAFPPTPKRLRPYNGMYNNQSSTNQTVEQCPREHEPRQTLYQPTRPQLECAQEISAHSVAVRDSFSCAGLERGLDAKGIYECAGDEGESEVEDEAEVGLES